MVRIGLVLVIISGVFFPVLLSAQTSAALKIAACSLLTKAEVKKHLPWNAPADGLEPEEEAVGTTGTACEYPSVRIQIMGRAPNDDYPIKNGFEPVTGLGRPAFIRHSKNLFAEFWVRTEQHTLMLQASTDGDLEAVKPGVVSLAKALMAKIP